MSVWRMSVVNLSLAQLLAWQKDARLAQCENKELARVAVCSSVASFGLSQVMQGGWVSVAT